MNVGDRVIYLVGREVEEKESDELEFKSFKAELIIHKGILFNTSLLTSYLK